MATDRNDQPTAPGKAADPGRTFISWTSMAILIATAVASVRGLPAMAAYDWASIFLYVLPAILFMVPVALVAAELASGWKGGVFAWVKEAYGDQIGFFAIWQQWMQNVAWYPAQLAFFASALAYVWDPSLANSGLFTGLVILVVYWVSTLIATFGVDAFAKVGTWGFLVGTLVPATALIVFAVIFLADGGKSQLPAVSDAEWFPKFTGLASIVLIVSNFLSYAGMEMNAVHVTEMRRPAKEFPKAIVLSVVLILFVFILPTLAISVGVPGSSVNLTQGVLQAFDVFFNHLGMSWGTTVMALLIVIGILASVVTWIPGPSKGLLLVGKDGYLPPRLQGTNSRGMQVPIMVAQGLIVTVLSILFAVLPSVQSVFWILTAMAVQLYLIMYMIMFLAAMKLRRTHPDVKRGFRSPAMPVVGTIGFVASLAAFILGFVEPSGNADSTPQSIYILILVAGIVLLGVWPFVLYRLRKPEWKIEPTPDGTDAHGPQGHGQGQEA
ncbi:APC family permease [Nocardioides marmotae]|uniref:Amino acid permease n=1 Tax=Nocardioides marmotae TaxID=2663857 RepID=A0A6I3J9Q8_9ACTN|nr:APC family permease [Nocardioides marmotae]MCR6030724.1 amino acid permease [Gordonia jinghuaiqii]MBC9734011.1 amino acid permease [Nocardioides marmotae]MTB85114.1 amino acid permease [Nocardioides marmotae]MTB94358.1 amino acid permease [Nocardioides marmotae]QKE01615.1 amino acid permease [Nocardioides marmotae]